MRLLTLICLIASTGAGAADDAAAGKEWSNYLGGSHRALYSKLKQINVDNVHQLREVWRYESDGEAQIQTNPLIVDGVLYGVSADRQVFALEADTGKELWKFKQDREEKVTSVVRGVAHWSSRGDHRILVTLGHHLYALDARTGGLILSFGDNGAVDIFSAFDRDVSKLSVGSTTPGTIYKDLIIITTRVSEGVPAAPGDILAFNVRTGKREWIFHTIPHPGEPGYETWPPEAWKTAGGANCWAGMSVDEKRGLLFVPTGSAAFDFYGADRIGDNLFANCIIALKADTGKLVWYYQTVHHDLWDRDHPAPPTLVTVEHQGKRRDAVAQITKSGYVFVLDRETGKPLFPVEEQPVPPSTIPGEEASPTQPIPLAPPPFARIGFTEDMVTQRTPAATAIALDRLRRAHGGSPYTPPTLEGTVLMPGFDGGGEWGGAAFDPTTGLYYVNSSEMPCLLTLYEITDAGKTGDNPVGTRVYAQNCLFCHGPDLKGDALREFPPVTDLKKKYTPELLKDIVKQGRGRMPSFLHLTEAETDAVVNLLYTLEERDTELFRQAATQTAPIDPSGKRLYAHTSYQKFLDPDGYPAIDPPWGQLTAIDLNQGTIAWQIPLGQNLALTDPKYRDAGTSNYGGPVVTAGGLLFIASTMDEKIRAFDKRTGEQLWEATLPAAGYATPATYSIRGRQYVTVAAAGGKLGTKVGNAYVTFSLP